MDSASNRDKIESTRKFLRREEMASAKTHCGRDF
jgi:hypothetical protein